MCLVFKHFYLAPSHLYLMGSRLLGFQCYTVISGSMEPEYSVGDLLYVKEVNPNNIKVGDPITFILNEDLVVATHRVVEIDANNQRFYTKGDANEIADSEPVHFNNVIGVPEFSIPKLGSFFNFMKTTPGYIVCIFVPFMLLIIYQGVKFFHLFRRYKKEQMEELEEERRKIEEERKQSAEMLLKLQELQEQLSSQQDCVEKAPEAPDAPPEQAPISPTETKEEVKPDPTEE